MTKTALKERVLSMEAELEAVKRVLIKEPDFAVDEKIWKAIKPAVKKVGKKLYARQYGKT
jgi:hypothetical protein